MPRISSKHQVTLPVDSLASAGLRAGDEVTIEAEGPDTIELSAPTPTIARDAARLRGSRRERLRRYPAGGQISLTGSSSRPHSRAVALIVIRCG